MIRIKKSGIVSLAASVVFAAALVGCSGSEGSKASVLIPFSASVKLAAGTVDTLITSSSSDQLVTLKLSNINGGTTGGTVDAVVPGGSATIFAGENVGIIDANQVLFPGTSVATSRDAGDLYLSINGAPEVKLTKVYLDKFSQLHAIGNDPAVRAAYLLLKASTNYKLRLVGPLTVTGATTSSNTTGSVTIGEVDLSFYTDSSARVHLPTSLDGTIPANGTTTPTGWSLTGTYDTKYDSDKTSLTISHANGAMYRKTTVLGGRSVFTNNLAGSNDIIPVNGVDSVSYTQAAP